MNFLAATREQTDLEKLIADSIAARDARYAEEEAHAQALEARYEALHRSLLAEAIEAIKPQIPAPLHQYLAWCYGRPNLGMLDARTWRPSTLHIIGAPGLENIGVSINWDSETPEVYKLKTKCEEFGPDGWAQAIAEANDRHKAMVEIDADLVI